MTDFSGLAIAGRVATPNDADWDQARLAWNLAADQHPSAVAFVESADDVAAAVRFAAENGLRVAGQGTGHGAVALRSLDDAILIKTERMRGIEIDAEAQTARVEAGDARARAERSRRQPTGSARCPAPRPTSASSATRSAAASAGSAAATASPATGCGRSSWSPPTASSGRSTPTTTPTSSGPCAAAAADYAIVTALHLDLRPGRRRLRRRPDLPRRARRRGRAPLPRLGRGVADDVTSVVRFLTPPPSPTCPSRCAARRC